MAFHLRRSISAGPFRFNLSKSGVGLSVGVRGLRVGTGPRGHYIYAGASGFYYRASIGRAGERPLQPPSVLPAVPSAPAIDNVDMQEIESGDVLAMTDARFQDVIAEINRKCRQMRFSSLLGWSSSGTAAGISLALAHPLPFLIVPPAYALGRWLDGYRRTTVLFYDLEQSVQDAYRRLVTAFERMSKSSKAWHVSAEGRVLDIHTWKRNAGADKLIKSTVITPSLRLPAEVKSNLDPPHLSVGKQDLYFFPDFVLVTDHTSAGAIPYSQLYIDVRSVRHIESGAVPSDAQVVDHTWQHPNKRGGPDRRFAFNRQLPICRYEELHLTSSSGLNELVTFSGTGGGGVFADAARSLAEYGSHRGAAAQPAPTEAQHPARNSSRRARMAIAIAGIGVVGLGLFSLGTRKTVPLHPPIVSVAKKQPVKAPPATGSIPPKNVQQVKKSEAPFDVVVAVSIQSNDRPVLLGRTNLPTGTQLVIVLSQMETALAATATVTDGRFRAEPFAQKGVSVRSGLYHVEVSSAPAALQPMIVLDVIGAKGQNLFGSATRIVSGERRVVYSQSLSVDQPRSEPSERKAAKAKLTRLAEACKGRCKSRQTKAKKLDQPVDWNRCYLECLADGR